MKKGTKKKDLITDRPRMAGLYISKENITKIKLLSVLKEKRVSDIVNDIFTEYFTNKPIEETDFIL